MWYEALPPMLIIGTLVYSYQITGCLIHKAFFGNPYRRTLEEVWERQFWDRDTRIAGAPWVVPGLENIPADDDDVPTKKNATAQKK